MYTKIMAFALSLSGIILVIPVFIMTYILFQDPVPVIILFNTVYPIMVLISLLVITKTDNDYHLILKYSTGARRVFVKYLWIVPLLILLITLINGFDELRKAIYRVNIFELMIVSAQSLLVILYQVSVYRFARIIIRWRAPELTLVRALADAFEIIAAASPANWRSISLRSKAARYIDKAAMTLQGPITRKFAASAGFSNAVAIQKRFQMAGAALRSKVTWLATPRAETQSVLGRALAHELLIAATGDLDRLEYTEIGPAESTTIGWVARLRATASWVIFGFGPTIFVIVSRTLGWITDPATTAILVQFAALCFFVAVFSAADPSGYKDRLSSVAGTGAALFGWRKPETKG
jgi:hypothetical protein